ncbi:MAG: hypothetical protein IIA03_01965, partial [Proteobacteria bacterium]|nr:hypothetical protein [Pseudomonadota bacterium]
MKAVLLALSLALAAMASAQTQPRQTPLYRCGPDGRDLRDSPCPSGPSASGSISSTVGANGLESGIQASSGGEATFESTVEMTSEANFKEAGSI